jgi:hypothetical protein
MIFVDRSIPKAVAEALKQVRGDVLWFEDRFRHDTKDTDWLPVAGASDWLVIARDKKIRTRPGERRILTDHKVGCFIISQKKNPTRWEYLKLLCATLDEMETAYAETARPFIYKVTAAGALRLV